MRFSQNIHIYIDLLQRTLCCSRYMEEIKDVCINNKHRYKHKSEGRDIPPKDTMQHAATSYVG